MPALELTDGGKLEFDDAGSGLPLVFLHGWSIRKEAFEFQLRDLAERFRVIVPDLRGHGNSRPAAAGDDIATLTGDIAELLDHLNLERVVLVGWSMGAMIAWDMALGPDARRVAGIVTIDMVPRVMNINGWSYGLRAGSHDYDVDIDLDKMSNDWPAFAKSYVPRIFAAGKGDDRHELTQEIFDLVQHNDVDSMMRLWKALVAEDYRDRLANLSVPTLITFGRLSQLYDEEASIWLSSHIPNSRRVGFAESGHAPNLEEPELFNATLAQFVDELESI